MMDRFAKRQRTASLKDKRQKWFRRIMIVSCLLSIVYCPLMAQSNLTYTVKVGTTGEVKMLQEFPESYAAEKINITLGEIENLDRLDKLGKLEKLDHLDFAFADRPVAGIAAWGDSIYSYTDEADVTWTVWRNKKELKNRAQKVLRANAYRAFEDYLIANTARVSQRGGWIWWVFAALLLVGTAIYGGYIVYSRRKEKELTAVEQEMLRRKRMGLRRHYGSQLYLWLLLLVLYAPIALIAVFSFTKSKILGNWTGFSMDLYVNLFTGKADAGLNSAIMYTLIIALVAAVCSTLLGTLAAIGIYNMRARQRKVVSFLNSVPMINPDIITGISLFLLFVALGFSQGLATVCIAHVVFCTPYVVLSVLPRLSRMNPNTYEAALDLGATPMQALRMVMLPELWPGMLSGFILALTLSVDDFGVTFFTKGSGGLETLSTFIYSDARKGGLTPELRPLFTLILIVMLGVLIYINFKDQKEEQS
jgi:spermidine/putrescine transport system permease protein